ncbi:MAG: phosphatase [Opitutaceae bacterium]|nr:phosphatase [Opitutaceae bacterium]
MRSVAVIDIGSNSIKVLVATRRADGGLATLMARAIDARISAGISRSKPFLGEEGMARGLAAIRDLLREAAPFQPARTMLVATSAVRDATNGAAFRERILADTGHEIRLLSGVEEAHLIGRGLTCDAALSDLQDFYVFDLGGGSLECLSFRQRRVEQTASLPLGCVRLTERFVADPTAPFTDDLRQNVMAHTTAVLRGGFHLCLPPAARTVGTGGTMMTVRAILGARLGLAPEAIPPVLTVLQLRDLIAWLAPMTLEARKHVPGLPPPRADVFPAALATLIAVAEAGGIPEFRLSLYNLRYGVADELLAH